MASGSSVLTELREVEGVPRAAGMLTLNRPDRLNAIDWEMVRSLGRALDELLEQSPRTILITGAGRAFSAGGDLKKYVELYSDAAAFPKFLEELHNVFGRLGELPVPVVALVNGVTAAGGLELLLNCDLAFASASARIGDGHLNFGQMGGGGVLTLLPRKIGLQRASELIYSGRFLTADEALTWGIVCRVVPDDELLKAGLEFAGQVAVKSPLGVANAKHVLNSLWRENASLEAGLALERERNAYYCLTSEDAQEGLKAFAEKRKPRFTGR
ncbi:MAG: enoyl-CoA hydratase/isomerase family protein [Chloroflexota bacterium]|nr:enoyl-CoA hydratase/isomerase family protein [Chloroflexota bacterium]